MDHFEYLDRIAKSQGALGLSPLSHRHPLIAAYFDDEAFDAGLVTFAPDDIDWEDDL